MTNCPKCGAEGILDRSCMVDERYDCGSFLSDSKFKESEQCLRNQLANANAEIERLREVLSNLPNTYSSPLAAAENMAVTFLEAAKADDE